MVKSNVNNRVKMFYGASPLIFERAKALRENMTPAEEKLWTYLSNKQLGVRFRRQHPINRFIADFYCHKCLLVIEVDGSVHNSDEAKEYDEMRTYVIREFGMQVIRFKNEEVLQHTEKVLDIIRKEIKERDNR